MFAVTEEYANWSMKDQKRVSHEWNQWDGTQEHGIAINDAQCERIIQAREKMKNSGFAEIGV